MDDPRLALARLHAGGPGLLAEPESLQAPARAAEHRIVRAPTPAAPERVTLAPAGDTTVEPEVWPIIRRELAESTLLTLAACLGCCWPDPTDDPYPGIAVPESTVLSVLGARGLDERWAKRALRRELPELDYVDLRGGHVHLGPAVAAMPRSEIALLRRDHGTLPRAGNEP